MRAVLKEMLHTIDVAITSEHIDSIGVTFRNGDSVHSSNVKLTPGLLYMHHGMTGPGDWEVFDVEEIVSVKVCLLDSVPDKIRQMSLPSFLTITGSIMGRKAI